MHNAPSVSYPVGRCAFHAGLLLLLSALGFSAGLLWWIQSAAPSLWLAAMGGVVWLMWSVQALRGWRSSVSGQLIWDARAQAPESSERGCWSWRRGDGSTHALDAVEWALDARSTVLLRLHGSGVSGRWVWLEARRDPAGWGNVRRALTAHAV